MCLERYISALLYSRYISTGALGGPSLLVSCSIITISLHITIILTIACLSTSSSTMIHTIQGELYSWGWNKFAQAGMSTPASTVPLIGEDSSRSGHREEVLCHPTLVQGLEGLEGRGYTDRGVDDDNDDEETTPFKVKKITAGSRHTAVLDEEGAVLVLGQVGLGGDLRPRLLCDGRTSKASDISSCLWTLGISYEQCGEKEKENGKKEEKEEDSRRKRAKIC